MGWREQIAARLIEAAKARDAKIIASGVGYPRAYPDKYPNAYQDLVSPHAAQQEINAVQSAERAFNDAKGDRLGAAEQTQQYLNELRSQPWQTPHRINPVEDTLGVLQSDHPLSAWWDK